MNDVECVRFLQWALPQMGLRWPGFRRVRRQVCRRVAARMQQLGLSQAPAYAAYLERNPTEWERLEALCGVTISRFYRDRAVFDHLTERILPDLARAAGPDGTLRAWSAGCASGEEPYTLALIWEMRFAAQYPNLKYGVLGTDREAELLARAARACYRRSSLRELPAAWIERAFERVDDEWCLSPALRNAVQLELQDLRKTLPVGPFALILCRNLAFTYFDDAEQRRVLEALAARLAPEGYLVTGAHERLPEGQQAVHAIAEARCIYRKRGSPIDA